MSNASIENVEVPVDHRTPEQIRHEAQIIQRDRKVDRAMMDFAAFGVSPSVKSLEVLDTGIAEVGTYTYFSLRRQWTETGNRRPAIVILFAGFKARVEGGTVVVGDQGRGNVCAYDLRYRPFPAATSGGKILSSTKGTTLALGLDLDQATEDALRGTIPTQNILKLPAFHGGFRPEEVPEVTSTPLARRMAVEAVSPGYKGPILPSLRSPGGQITCFFPDAEGGIGIGFDGTEDNPEKVVLIPKWSVLRPFIQKGVQTEEGTALADFLPRRSYSSYNKLVDLYGQETIDWLVSDVVIANDFKHDDLVLRRAELCNSLQGAVKVYEDIRDLDDCHPQVVSMRGPTSLQVFRPGVEFDLFSIREAWDYKFNPPVRESNEGNHVQESPVGASR